MLSVERASVRIGGQTILDAVDLDVCRGEIVTLIGPNGSGKTTLVRLALGLLEAHAGRVALARGIRVGYVPQRLQVDPTLPVTVARFLRLGGGRDRRGLRRTLREVGVAHLEAAPLHALSGGEARRVLLARALLREPHLLVLDEPTAGVDLTGQSELYRLIHEIRDRQGCGVLLVSHDLHLVMAATDRVVCLNHHVCCVGRPEAVSRHPEYLALFGAPLREPLAVYTHRHDHRHDLAGNVEDTPVERGDADG
ncbi:MAG: ATP-binding cassette domain-containing protein [Gammaproteobacteria bacterium]|nr:ATP-binding cassette domain-containing protein [Gammaproteobacteria bacterium]